MHSVWKAYRSTLAKELGDSLAHEFVTSLYRRSQGDVEKATHFFYTLGSQWAPLMHAWHLWVEANATGTVALILRDAKPLSAVPATSTWKRLYLNRLTCGISDELSGDVMAKAHPLLLKYLQQHECAEHFTFVDSGCYGTVVLELHKLGIRFQPLFFFSKNPHIRGFLNEAGLTKAEGEILNDSLECAFPHAHLRPSELEEKNGIVGPVLQMGDQLSILFGEAATRGVAEGCTTSSNPLEAARHLLSLSTLAHEGVFTGVLGHSSPEWSKCASFLAQWPASLHWND